MKIDAIFFMHDPASVYVEGWAGCLEELKFICILLDLLKCCTPSGVWCFIGEHF